MKSRLTSLDYFKRTISDCPFTFPDCKEFNSRNCSLNGGMMNLTGVCIFPNMTTAEEWDALNATTSSLKSPAHEYFQ